MMLTQLSWVVNGQSPQWEPELLHRLWRAAVVAEPNWAVNG